MKRQKEKKENGKHCNAEKIEINDDNEMQNTDKLTGSLLI